MNDHTVAVESEDQAVSPYVPPPVRTFRVRYTDKTEENFAAHYYDTSTGQIVFIDEVLHPSGTKRLMYYRRTVAAGQWKDITEITVGNPLTNTRVN